MIGKLYMARGMSYKLRGNLGKHRPRPVPAGLNWDAWVGPAKMVEYSSFNHHRWYWISNFASGDIANQTAPRRRHHSLGARPGHASEPHDVAGRAYLPAEDDDADTPNCQSLVCQWEGRNLQVSFEIRHWFTNTEAGMGDKYPFLDGGSVVGVIFFGSEGYMIIPDYSSYYTFLGADRTLGPHATATKPQLSRNVPGMVSSIMDLPHFQNWIAACRSRKHEDLNADVEQGHLSTAMCHLAKISNHLKRSVQFDPKTERFINDEEANKLLKREYREPYVVPDQV